MGKKKAVTLKDISEKAGLSVATVSDILNDKPKCYAGEAARKRVFKLVEELGYRPNLLYKSMRQQKTNTIGLIVPNLHVNVSLANIEVIEDIAWKNDYHVYIGYSQNDIDKEEDLLKDFVNRRVDGIILIVGREGENRKELQYIIDHAFPFVTIGRFQEYNVSSVSTDYYTGGRLAARHLSGLGFSRVGVMVMTSSWGVLSRKAGFLDEAAECGMSVQDLCSEKQGSRLLDPDNCPVVTFEKTVNHSFSRFSEGWRRGMRPEAVFAGNDYIALGIVRAATELGIHVPEELSVIGFDDSPSAIFSFVPLTTVRQKREEVGRRAVKMLFDKIDSQAKADALIEETIPPELVVRQSTARKN